MLTPQSASLSFHPHLQPVNVRLQEEIIISTIIKQNNTRNISGVSHKLCLKGVTE